MAQRARWLNVSRRPLQTLFHLYVHIQAKENRAPFKEQEECGVTIWHPGGQEAFN